MSFQDMKLAELKQIADSFGVELPAKPTKTAAIKALEEEGVDFDQYTQLANVEKEEIEVPAGRPDLELANEETLLVKMERSNMSYQIQGYTFTQEHPFIAMPIRHATFIFANHSGFRPAHPQEVQDFYS